MFTKEQLLSNSQTSKLLAKVGSAPLGVLTPCEQTALIAEGRNRVECFSSHEKNVFWFTDDYCMGVGLLPKHYVPCSVSLPMKVVPRESLPTGIISTVEEYAMIFHHGQIHITSIEELVDFLNASPG